MSTHIYGFVPDTDETYQRMKKVLLACDEADMELPEAAAKYFGAKYPDVSLLEEKLEVKLKNGVHYKDYNGDMQEGFEVDIDKLPKGVTKIRFVNSY